MSPQNPPATPVPISQDEVDLLKKYRDIVMPAARLAGYDDFAKWLFTITATIGTLGAAFSNAALKSLGGAGAFVFFLALVATGISLALAVIQRTIDISKPNWQSLDDMLQKTESLLRVKRGMAWAAGGFFASAILLAGLAPLVATRSTPTSVGSSLTYSYGKDGVHAGVTLAQRGKTEAELAVFAHSTSGETLIATQRAAPDASGVVRFDLTSAAIPTGSTGVVLTLRCDVKDNKTLSFSLPFQRPSASAGGKADESSRPQPIVSCE